MRDEPYVISDERLAEIRSYLAETQAGWQIHPAHGVTGYMLAGAVFDLLAERDENAESPLRGSAAGTGGG